MKSAPFLVAVACGFAIDGAFAQGTVNVPGLNHYFVTPPAVGLPPPGTPCPSPVVPLSVAASPLTFFVDASLCPTSPGSPTFGLINIGMPCAPAFVCLPPVLGCYGGIPPAVSCPATPFAPPTNQSIDLLPGSFLLFNGAMGPGGVFTSLPVALFPAFVGVPGSTQAFFIDFATGFVTTEAWDFVIVP